MLADEANRAVDSDYRRVLIRGGGLAAGRNLITHGLGLRQKPPPAGTR
jgi:hypothetical protein